MAVPRALRVPHSSPPVWLLALFAALVVLLPGSARAASCGGVGERACCWLEAAQACHGDGAFEMPGCSGDCWCSGIHIVKSQGTCAKATHCGGTGQRTCMTVFREGFHESAWTRDGTPLNAPCKPGLTPVNGCTGDCFVQDPLGLGHVSWGTCGDLRPSAKPWEIDEVSTGFQKNLTPACTLRGFADLHVHMFSHLGNGGALLAGKPYVPTPAPPGGLPGNDINAALRPDYNYQGTPGDFLRSIDGDPMWDHVCPPEIPKEVCGNQLWHGDHTLFDNGTGFGTQDTPPSNFGAPLFIGWPHWKSTIHQQVYYKWLERAWHGGMRIMTMLAVSNEAVCKTSRRKDGVNCNEQMESIGAGPHDNPIDQQLDAAYAFEAWLDVRSGGPGKGWFRIVKTPLEARQAILRGKLAVVLGIEVDNLFNCREKSGPWSDVVDWSGHLQFGWLDHPKCTAQDVKDSVEHYYQKGVRHVFPVHNFDNAFGAAAAWQTVIAVANGVVEDRMWDIENCRDQYGFWIDPVSASFITGLGFLPGYWLGWGGYPQGGPFPLGWGNSWASCNRRGLFTLGKDVLLPELMKRGMLIDVDHMSNKSFAETLDLAEAKKYPVVASHVLPAELHSKKYEDNLGRHERMRTREQLQRIRGVGGMVALMMKDDVQDGDHIGKKYTHPWGWDGNGNQKVADDCRHSSKSWAQSYQYLKEIMGGPIAFGSDFNGTAGHLGPRFGSEGCSGVENTGLASPFHGARRERSAQLISSSRLSYPFTLANVGEFRQQSAGQKDWDYNVNGLAHIGLYPDFIADLGVIGLSQADVEPIYKSAEEYVRVWERAVQAGTGAQPDPGGHEKPVCEPITVSADPTTCGSSATVWTADQFLDPDIEITQSPPGPYPIGTTNVTITATSPNGCAPPVTCQTTITVADRAGPGLICPRSDVVVECQGKNTPAKLPRVQGPIEWCSPPASPIVCDAPPDGLYPYGSTTVTCSSHDAAGNEGHCTIDVLVEDRVPPVIFCPPAQVIECASPLGAAFSPGPAKAEDSCSPVTVSAPPARVYPLGTSHLTYTATDLAGNTATCDTAVTVQDTLPPEVKSVTAQPERLWPANGRMRRIELDVRASDRCDRRPSCSIAAVTVPDEKAVVPAGDLEVRLPLGLSLRASTAANRPDRTYLVQLVCVDDAKNATTAEVKVRVAAQ
jgi:microsomal dipeptidase-like Zn-dependent dipeptidase